MRSKFLAALCVAACSVGTGMTLAVPSATAAAADPVVSIAGTPSGNGYWTVTAGGKVTRAGDAQYKGDARYFDLDSPIAGIESTASGDGY